MYSRPSASSTSWEQARSATDPCLYRFLFARTEQEALLQFDRLDTDFLTIDIQTTVLRELWRGKPVSTEELLTLNDSFGDLVVALRGKLFRRLIALRRQFAEARDDTGQIKDTIRDLRSYTATVAEHGCVDYLRQKYPGRHALDVNLRAICDGSTMYGVWREPLPLIGREWRIGKREWQAERGGVTPLRDDSQLQYQLRNALDGVARPDVLEVIFSLCETPLRYTELLNFLADLWKVEEIYRMASLESVPIRIPKPYLVGVQPEEIVTRVGVLHEVWRKLEVLTSVQAVTLLLKSPQFAEGSFLEELVRLEVATWETISRKTQVSVSNLKQVSPRLPLEDSSIAEILGVEVDTVRRIRQDARLKLERQDRKNKQ